MQEPSAEDIKCLFKSVHPYALLDVIRWQHERAGEGDTTVGRHSSPIESVMPTAHVTGEKGHMGLTGGFKVLPRGEAVCGARKARCFRR